MTVSFPIMILQRRKKNPKNPQTSAEWAVAQTAREIHKPETVEMDPKVTGSPVALFFWVSFVLGE